MTDKKPKHPIFRPTADWLPIVPEPLSHLTEADWIKKSHNGTAPPFIKLNGIRSTAYWRASDIYHLFERVFAKAFPESLEALREAGFAPARTELTGFYKNKNSEKTKKNKNG